MVQSSGNPPSDTWSNQNLTASITKAGTHSVLLELMRLSFSPLLVAVPEGGLGKVIRSLLAHRVAGLDLSPPSTVEGVVGTATLMPSGVYSFEVEVNGSSSSPSTTICDDTRLLLDGPEDRLLLLEPPLAVTNREKNPRRGEDDIE